MRSGRFSVVVGIALLLLAGVAFLNASEPKVAESIVKIVPKEGGGFTFDPAKVTIKPGDSVRFKNTVGTHTATSLDIKTGDPKKTFNTGIMKKDQETVIYFNVPGTFDYRCEIHTDMMGSIIVEAPK